MDLNEVIESKIKEFTQPLQERIAELEAQLAEQNQADMVNVRRYAALSGLTERAVRRYIADCWQLNREYFKAKGTKIMISVSAADRWWVEESRRREAAGEIEPRAPASPASPASNDDFIATRGSLRPVTKLPRL